MIRKQTTQANVRTALDEPMHSLAVNPLGMTPNGLISTGLESNCSIFRTTVASNDDKYIWELEHLISFSTGAKVRSLSMLQVDKVLHCCAGLNTQVMGFVREEGADVRMDVYEHGDCVNDVQLTTPDIGMMGSCGDDHVARIWNVETQQECCNLRLKSPGMALRFHHMVPHQVLVAEKGGIVKMFDIRDGVQFVLALHVDETVLDCDWKSSDPLWVGAVSSAGNQQLWQLRRPDIPVENSSAHSCPAKFFRFGPEGLFATCGGSEVKVWDMAQSHVATTFNTLAPVSGIGWAPNRCLCIGSDKSLYRLVVF